MDENGNRVEGEGARANGGRPAAGAVPPNAPRKADSRPEEAPAYIPGRPEPASEPRRAESLSGSGDSGFGFSSVEDLNFESPGRDEPRPAPTPPSIPHPEKTKPTVNLIPPDRKRPDWWHRHGRKVNALEWTAAVILIVIGLYYLWFLVFPPAPPPPPPPPTPPSLEEFQARLRQLPPVREDPAWKVEAQKGRWRRIVIHHTATNSGNPKIFDDYHRKVRGWENGLAYHFVIGNGHGMEDGEVAVGPRWEKQLNGAHVKSPEKDNANSYSIGIALVGNFDNYLPTPKQLASLVGLVTFLRDEYGIGLANIVGHRDLPANETDCPGDWFFVNEIVRVVANQPGANP